MAQTPSKMIPLGTKAPSFCLPDTLSGEMKSLETLKSDVATVIMFICNHCPFVKHILNKLIQIAKEYQKRGVSFIAISSNDVEHYPEDSPEQMRKLSIQMHFSFPYLYDETQEVAKAYQATCTPDFFIYDKNLSCVYRGRFDASTPRNAVEVTGNDLSNALDEIMAGNSISKEQNPSIGCNIKWKSNNHLIP